MVRSYTATSLREALELRRNPELTPYAGGTDLMVHGKEDASYLFLHNVPEMKQIVEENDCIRFGAACTFAQVIQNPHTPNILREACLQVAAPAIRNAGTLGGNIANGSAKADSALVFMAAGASLRIASANAQRVIPIKEFYLSQGQLALAPDELIVEILMPKRGLDYYYYIKVGAREALSISRVSFAGILDAREGVIMHCATAFGAVSDVIFRREDIDNMLVEKTINQAKGLKEAYLKAFDEAIQPIRGRVSIEYRKTVCMNLLRDFLQSNGI